MAEKNINDTSEAKETVSAASIGKAANPISKGTLVMIAGVIIFVIIVGILISQFFSAPAGNGSNGSGSTYTTSTNRNQDLSAAKS